jgi:hypothetical protein
LMLVTGISANTMDAVSKHLHIKSWAVRATHAQSAS